MPFFTHAGAELHYELTGEGPPLLLLHALGSSLEDWELQVTAFKDRFRVITVSMRGSGQSRDVEHPNGPFSVKQFAEDAAALLVHLELVPAHVVGLSMGGAVALQLAASRPEVVASVVSINSAAEFVARDFKDHALLALRRVVARVMGPRGMAKLLAPRLFPAPEHQALRDLFIERMSKNRPGAYAATQLATLNWSVKSELSKMAMPALVVGAEHDYSLLAGKREWAAQMQRAEYVEVPGTHHALPIEAPEAFNAVLARFLDKQVGPRT